ncbi:SGNH/GDSL hydrolase family protein [Streptomyces hoynatensis]|uniref:SGNH/GDSL hydrolase family protein n=1 Tax=Streptomyces hoynatensis TaxID=1141874 RepID=A0A3A9ZD51_9ACTN|nr:SGNH/GDSL hydrolase family protein [Streptomyces hoynatensis]
MPLAALACCALLAACTSGASDGSEGPRQQAAASAEPEPEAPAWNPSPRSVAAIGDSITRAFDACSLLSDCPEASWATGTDESVDSLARQLLGGEGDIAAHAWNLAESGATVADLPAQAAAAVAHEPDLITVLIGANDACADDVADMTATGDFRAAFTEAMGTIREELPTAEVYVASVPDLMHLWEEGSGSLMARAVWRMADICPTMLNGAGDEDEATAGRRTAVRERVEEYNAVLEEVCGADALCRYDGGAVFDYPFTSRHISDWDWFHPSRAGQSELAALAYEEITRD